MTEAEKQEILSLFGENIKRLRKQQNLSLLQADYQSSIDESNLSKYEHGKRDLRLSTIFKLAKMLKTHPKNLLDLGIDYSEEKM